MPGTRFSIGIDVGASKTHLLAHASPNGERIEIQGPAANPKRVGMEEATSVLLDLVERTTGATRRVEQLSLCAGVAGAGRREEQAALADRLTAALQDSADSIQVDVVHDAIIALETAFGPDSGLVVITGTGSVGVGRTTNGDLKRVGGWGHLLGDPGSGYAIGRAGLRAVAEAFEGGPDTVLRDRVEQTFDVTDRDALIRTVYADHFHIPNVAPLVSTAAAADDPVATRILDHQTDQLAQQIEWLIERAPSIASQIALIGGMVRNDHYAHTLRRTLLDRFSTWDVEIIQEDPVVGGLQRARRLQSEAAD